MGRAPLLFRVQSSHPTHRLAPHLVLTSAACVACMPQRGQNIKHWPRMSGDVPRSSAVTSLSGGGPPSLRLPARGGIAELWGGHGVLRGAESSRLSSCRAAGAPAAAARRSAPPNTASLPSIALRGPSRSISDAGPIWRGQVRRIQRAARAVVAQPFRLHAPWRDNHLITAAGGQERPGETSPRIGPRAAPFIARRVMTKRQGETPTRAPTLAERGGESENAAEGSRRRLG
jgi:hypothetical protein